MLDLPDPRFNGYEISASVSLSFLPGVRTVDIHGEIEHGNVASDTQFAYYRSLTQSDFPSSSELDDHAFACFEQAAAVVDVGDFGLRDVNRTNIEAHYEVQRIVVPPLWETRDRYLIFEGNCDWDPEHGIQFIVKNATVIRCGESDGIYQGLGWDALLGHQR